MTTHVKLENEDFLTLLSQELLKAYLNNRPIDTILVNKDYETFAEKIENILEKRLRGNQRQKIGVKISGSTLERLMKYNFSSFHTNTLSKLSIFLGYKSWLDFKKIKQELTKPPKRVEKRVLKELIKQAIEFENQSYQSLPKIDMENLKTVYINDSSTIKNFEKLLKTYKKRKWRISRLDSSIYRLQIHAIYTHNAYATCIEHRNFEWLDVSTGKIRFEFREWETIYFLIRPLSETSWGRVEPYWRIENKCLRIDAFANTQSFIDNTYDSFWESIL